MLPVLTVLNNLEVLKNPIADTLFQRNLKYDSMHFKRSR